MKDKEVEELLIKLAKIKALSATSSRRCEMSRLTQVYTDAEENYIDLICFENLDSYDVLCEVLDSEQCHGLIDAIYKLAEYEDIGSVEEIKQVMDAYRNELNEVKQLKSEQNKVAVEKLEELLKESSVEYHLCDSAGGKYKCSIYAVNDIFIKEQIKELQGE